MRYALAIPRGAKMMALVSDAGWKSVASKGLVVMSLETTEVEDGDGQVQESKSWHRKNERG
jgi:hypothetical protein